MGSGAPSKTLCYISQLAEFKDSRVLPLPSLKAEYLWMTVHPFELEWFIILCIHQAEWLASLSSLPSPYRNRLTKYASVQTEHLIN